MPLGEGVSPNEGERGANASLTHRPGVSVTLQHSQGGATQLTRYAIDMEILVFLYIT